MTVQIEREAEPIQGYRLMERLGSGGFGEVWKAEAPGGIYKAIKIIFGDLRNKENDAHRFAEQELKALKRVKQVRHPYLLALDRFDIIDGRLMIVMELADCNLWDRFRECRDQGLPGIPREELLNYMAEAAEVLDLMYDRFQLQHLDIKPQNLFLLYDHVKVADFGQVKDLDGMVASVTGGITPVYAAPETFDGFVSRYCDQYSLACVYLELLSGKRPFDGTSMQQLLVQHLQQPPNLTHAPVGDRPSLLKALAKKPEHRFSGVREMVASMRSGLSKATLVVHAPTSNSDFASATIEALSGISNTDAVRTDVIAELQPLSEPVTPLPKSLDQEYYQVAPPEQSGDGPLRPTLILGLGHTGQRVLQRLTQQLIDQFGSLDRLPALKMLYIDTDPEALESARHSQPHKGWAALAHDTIYGIPLNRPAHYLKPRINGRTLIEGWLDPQMLYRLSRTPSSMGLRAFGRLAWCDHYRSLMQTIAADLETVLSPVALKQMMEYTGLNMATNRPRIHIIAGLGGGSGSGCFLDAAYSMRALLKRMGYTDPQVSGLLLAPHDEADMDSQVRANTYAALTELNHYSQPRSKFEASYDERQSVIRDMDAPFNELIILPGLSEADTYESNGRDSSVISRSGTIKRGSSKTRMPFRRKPFVEGCDPTDDVANVLRLRLFSELEYLLEQGRQQTEQDAEPKTPIRSFGFKRFTWPRAAVIDRTARVITPVVLMHWVNPDATYIRQSIPQAATELFDRLHLDCEVLAQRMLHLADGQLHRSVRQQVDERTMPIKPRGWLGRLPEPSQVEPILQQLIQTVGRPKPLQGERSSILSEALNDVVEMVNETALTDMSQLILDLIESPTYRLAGTEEVLRRMLSLLDGLQARLKQLHGQAEKQVQPAFDTLMAQSHYQKGMRKVSVAEFNEALDRYPHAQIQKLCYGAASAVYKTIRHELTMLHQDVTNCRRKLERVLPQFHEAATVIALDQSSHDLLPPGCATTEDAAQTFLASLTDDDLIELEGRIQVRLEEAYGGLYQACLNTTQGLDGLLNVIATQTRLYLNDRLGEVDLAAMFFAGANTASASQKLRHAYEQAAPQLLANGPWSKSELTLFAAPRGAGGDPIRDQVSLTFPEKTLDGECQDEIVIYRESTEVALSVLPQLGPGWASAYEGNHDAAQPIAHARFDVTQWIDVDNEE